VISETSFTGILFSRSNDAVPPVEMSSTPNSDKARENSTTPFLSETLIRALVILATGQGSS
jgi:hypothetical protein